MALARSVVSFPFTGVSEKESPMLLDPGEALRIENGFFQVPGEVRKRFGYSQIYNYLGYAGAKWISPTMGEYGPAFATRFDGSIFCPDANQSGTFEPLAANPAYYSRCVLNRLRAFRTFGTRSTSAVALTSNYTDVAYVPTSGALWSVSEKSISSMNLSTGLRTDGYDIFTTFAKVVSSGIYVAVFKHSGTTLTVSIVLANGTSLGGTVASNVDATGYFDVQASATTANRINVAYRRTAAGGITCLQINAATGAITIAAVTDATEDVTQSMSWMTHDESNGFAYLITASANGVRTRSINATTLAIGAATNIHVAATNVLNVTGHRSSGGTNYVIYDYDDGTTNGRCVYQNGTMFIRDAVVLSRAFRGANARGSLDHPMVWVGNYPTVTQGTAFLYEFGSFAFVTHTWPVVATAQYAQLSNAPVRCGLSSVVALSSYVWAVSFPCITVPAGETTAKVLGSVCVTVDFEPTGVNGTPESFGGSVHLAVASPMLFDGAQTLGVTSETGLAPEAPTLVSQTTAGSLTLLATYQYVAVYMWTDRANRQWRSAPSTPLTVTLTGSNNKANIRVRMPGAARTGRRQVVELYRTGADGVTLYLQSAQTGVSGNESGASGAFGVAYLDFADTLADAAIDGNEQIYTGGGELPNFPGKNWVQLKQWRGRLFGISAEDPTRVYYTKALEDGIGPSWVGVFNFSVPDDEGDFTAIGEMDDKLILFKRSAIYVLTGDGPDRLGNNLYPFPERITTRAGCVNPVSIVKTPVGLIYSSPKGIQLLSRGLETQYIGAPVETTWATLTITGAVCVDDQNQVRFLSSNGTTLVYDWVVGAWTTFTNQVALHACIWQNKVTWISSTAGLTQQETPNVWTDNGSYITTTVATGWLSFSSLQTFKRVRGLRPFGLRMSAHSIIPKVAYDENTASEVTLATIADLGAGVPYQPDAWIARQKLGSLKVTISDSISTGTGEGARWHGLAFVVGVKKGIARTTG